MFSSCPPMLPDPHALLEKYFGFREFLDAQEEVVSAIIGGGDALVVMPTGGGKSLCYQLPALMLDGVTVVVSPLIALMKDQVDALEKRGIPAALINSSLSLTEQQSRIRKLAAGEYKLIYIAPERFRSRSFLEALGQATISLFAIDEAHCISQWGHDFRPDYFRLGEVIERLGRPQVAAFTATATPEVRRDILAQLNLREPREFVAGFSRPNLRLGVFHVENEAAKYDRLNALIKKQKTGIVYCATRKRVEAVQAALAGWGVKTIAYHGGLNDAERELAQNHFINRHCDVAVATNAFGMGIDRSDIRFVAHFEVPGSLEAYYQEAGRAGRDGEPAVCELYFNYADTRVQEFFIEGSNPSREIILEVYRTLRAAANMEAEVMLPIRDIAERVTVGEGGATNEMAVGAALSILHRADYIDRFDLPGQRTRGTRICQPNLKPNEIKLDWNALGEKERRDRSKLKSVVDFSQARICRQQAILRYFGEPDPPRCGNCDICLAHAHYQPREATEEEILVVRKALSGVARMSHRTAEGWQGRFGRGRIVQALLGSRSKEIVDARLDQLSTHGLLRDEGISYLNELFRELLAAGLLAQDRRVGFDGKEYQMITLSALGEQVMRGQAKCEIAWPERGGSGKTAPAKSSGRKATVSANRRSSSADELPNADAGLLAALKQKREELAQARGNVPRYQIFPDETLVAFARLKPASIEAGKRIRGVGEVKAGLFLPQFLEVIQRHTTGSLL
jgi:ATP-dependent DNA helicase RecQ